MVWNISTLANNSYCYCAYALVYILLQLYQIITIEIVHRQSFSKLFIFLQIIPIVIVHM